jgi:polysaccharide biosynthesis PFTS motif protein
MMRGYRYIKLEKRFDLIRSLKLDLTISRLWPENMVVSQEIYGSGSDAAELITRQYLLTRYGGIGLNKAILCSLGSDNSPIIYPLPKVWQDLLIKHGYSVAKVRCSLSWSVQVAIMWLYGVFRGSKIIFEALSKIIQPVDQDLKRYAYFSELSSTHLPQLCQDGRSHDVITWYSKWKGRPKSLNAICHSVVESESLLAGEISVEYRSSPVPSISTMRTLLHYTGWFFQAICRAAYDALRGKWWHAMLLAESAVAAKARLINPDQLAREYLFHNSSHIYRPLWTYEAVSSGSRIIFYFYSLPEQFKSQNGYVPDNIDWGATNWPHYLVWDVYQEEFIRRAVSSDNVVEIVDPIWFQSNAVELPVIPHKSIAVFDVSPFRNSAHFGFTTIAELYWGHDVENKFLIDIKAALLSCGGMMVYKGKRGLGKQGRRKYTDLLMNLANDRNIIFIDSGTSPFRVVEACQMVISLPFTSTALIGKKLGKPSVYYDPLGILDTADRGAHGIEILSGPKKLEDWIAKMIAG